MPANLGHSQHMRKSEWFPETDEGRTAITQPGPGTKAIVELNFPEDCFACPAVPALLYHPCFACPALPCLAFPLLHFFLEAISTSLRANISSRTTLFSKLSCVGSFSAFSDMTFLVCQSFSLLPFGLWNAKSGHCTVAKLWQ